MKSASNEFTFYSNLPPEPPPLPAQTLEIDGHKYVLNQHFKNIQIVSHRYAPLIPMSVDEQEVPTEISPSMAANIPQLVHDQLTNGFLPAAKNVGQAGMHLLKTYYMFQEALSNYCDATHKLIKSADTAGHKSKNEATELSKIFKEFVQGVNAHQKIIVEFDTLAHKVHDYSSKDKEKIKAEFTEYKKEEKKILKRKSGETEKDIAAFYRKAAFDWSRQQELRYKFFNDKLHSWINGYVELGKLFQTETDTGAENLVVGAVVSQNLNAELHEVNSEEENSKHWHDELHDQAALVTEKKHVHVEVVSPPELSDNRSNSTSSVATTLEDLPSGRRFTNEATGVTLVSNNRRNSIEIVPIPPQALKPVIQPTQTLPAAVPRFENHTSQLHSTVPAPAPASAPAPISNIRHDENAYIARHQKVVANQVPEQPNNSAPGGVRRAGNTIPGAVNVFGFANQADIQPKVRYTPVVQNGSSYQVVTSDHIRVGRVVDNPVTEEEMNAKKFHVEANYLPMAAPSHQAQHHSHQGSSDISVPSFFTPSQYGSILIVNDDFNASSGEQMTVNRGDKVVLLKCGSRGWVFVRDSISNRTGWVPEPYVNP
uniref:SH3 domain-containing protein n=1 Tax=Caenorhabditis japonica TaxID=281687 RepID=A0A8R1I7B0_CAEJA